MSPELQADIQKKETLLTEKVLCMLNTAMNNLSRASKFDEVLSNIINISKELFNCKVIRIVELKQPGNIWNTLKEYSSSPGCLAEFNALQEVVGSAQEKFEQGLPLVVKNLNHVGKFLKTKRQLHVLSAFPLFTKGKISGGIIQVSSTTPVIPQLDCILLLLGNYIGNVIGNAQLFQTVEHAKKEWENTFDSISDLVAIIDKDFNIIRVNKAFGVSVNKHPRYIIGKKCYELMHSQNQPAPNCPHLKTLKYKKSTTEEVECLSQSIIHQVTTSPILNQKGEIAASAHIAHNISERKKLEHQLLQMQKMESLGTLAGGIAHDFNNLLEGVLGYSSYLKKQVDPNNQIYQELQIIENSAEQAANLSKQLLTFARKGEYQLKPINVNSIIDNIIKLLSRTLDKNITILNSCNGENAVIEGDAGQLEQTILNLCINARDAMPQGGKLTIETQIVYLDKYFARYHMGIKPGHYVLMSISDTGIGMDKTTKRKIFEPFFTTKKKGQGTGLGMAMVYGIVKTHKGHIDVYSEKNKGTIIKVYLPLCKDSAELIPHKPVRKKYLHGHETILVVDDELMIRDLIGKLLKQNGYKVYMAEDGSQAVDVFKEHSKEIDLVILDMITPRMNGQEAYNSLKNIRKSIKVLLSSGYSPDEQMEDVIQKAQGFIQKPYRVEELLSKIRDALKQPSK